MNSDPVAASNPANSTDASIGIVVSDWHSEITSAMLESAVATLKQCGVSEEDICISHVPGAMELTFAARQMSNVQESNAVIMLGCVVKEDNPQYESIIRSVTQGYTHLNLHGDSPYIFGILTVDTLEQAKKLVAGEENQGAQCARAALNMANMMAKLIYD
ncbi:MAG: 6,7-dimethyl-8-ribityllumazine synthase [Bacteroidales bacterium]|nr:6,7-dimethyl-8-ribityllumazine synthase [Bacteroidales bacterium]